jgi:RIO kinase 1
MPKNDRFTRLSRGEFVRGSLRSLELESVMSLYGDPDVPPEVRFPHRDTQHDRLITEVTGVIGDGKEATVYRCRADPRMAHSYVAVKVYRADKFRAFKDDAIYRAGEHVRDSRMRRAIEKGTRAGRLLGHHDWIEREWQHMCLLHGAGADVPEPLACAPDSIAMQYLGDADRAAPRLQQVGLRGARAQRVLDAILYNIELFLRCDRVHGDLSPYNILYCDERPFVIDLPQMVTASQSHNARALLWRDLANICRYFERSGISVVADDIAASLWRRFQRAEL